MDYDLSVVDVHCCLSDCLVYSGISKDTIGKSQQIIFSWRHIIVKRQSANTENTKRKQEIVFYIMF